MSQPQTYLVERQLGGHGGEYQRLFACCILLGIMTKCYEAEQSKSASKVGKKSESEDIQFKLAFEMTDAGKFDDVCIYIKGKEIFKKRRKHGRRKNTLI